MKRVLCIMLCFAMGFALNAGFVSALEAASLTPGTYRATVNAMHGPLTVEVVVDADKIVSIEVVEHYETPGVGTPAIESIPAAIVEHQSLAVDVVSGVTLTSAAIRFAVQQAIVEAGGAARDWRSPIPREEAEDIELTADVVIVGGGGAGITAAITALKEGASVILIEKMGFLGGNSIVAGGIYNAPDPSKQDHAHFPGDLDSMVTAIIEEQPVSELHAELIEIVKAEFEEYKNSDKTLFDSPAFFALQTWNAGDKVAHLEHVRMLAENSLEGLEWLMDIGVGFQPNITLASGSLYPRTHRHTMPNSVGYFIAFEERLKDQPNYTQLMDTNATALIMDGSRVVGVEAIGKEGNSVTLRANNGVILATGGFGANVELRREYGEGEKWPDLGPGVPTTNMPGVTGDGIFMARDAGAQLINMEHIQLLHLCNPETGATYDVVLVGGDAFVNQEGLRFVREDGRRDEMSQAIIAQTGGIMYIISSAEYIPDPSAATALGGMNLQYMLDNNISGFVSAPTLEELAEKINVPADAFVQTIADFNTYVAGTAQDPLGRAAFTDKLETGPFFAHPRAPAVHHTMGGVLIDEFARALNENGEPVPGLYCAGEITGVLHGSNRVGGNAIVDYVVYGRIAGASAAAAK